MLMRRGGPQLALLLALLGLALVIAGCGASSSTSSESGSGAEPSAQFLKKNGKNTIPEFGEEASAEEREAVNTVVVKNLKARQAADWATQCNTLSMKGIAEIPGAKNHQDCPTALKKLGEPLSVTKGIRTDTLSGSIAAFRIEGERGYALYHGNDGRNHALPLEKEDGVWKVGSINTIEL